MTSQSISIGFQSCEDLWPFVSTMLQGIAMPVQTLNAY